MVNTYVDQLVQELRLHILLVLSDVLDQLLEMLFLWFQGQGFQKVFVDQWVDLHLLLCKNISSKEVIIIFSLILGCQGREEHLIEHVFDVWDH